jgi:hypothetical protein
MARPQNTSGKRVAPEFKAQMGKGRPKGALNKHTILAKQAIAEAAEKLGGTDRLVAWAREDEQNERVFWSSIYTKLIPVQTEITGKNGEAIQVEQKIHEDAHAFRSRLLQGLVAGATSGGAGETVQ